MTGIFWRRFVAQRSALAGLATLAALILVSLAAPALAPQDPGDPLGFDPADANHPPSHSWTFLLGADSRGRSVLALLLWGGRASLAVGLGSAVLATFVGMALGALAAYRSRLDVVLASLMDLCQAAPPLLVALVLASRLGGVEPALLILAFAASGWAAPARLTRAALGAGLRAPYSEAARAAGSSGPRLLLTCLRLEALGAVATWTASAAAAYLALAAGLDFLGLGLPTGSISWGTALAGAQDALAGENWWWLAWGGLELAIATVSLHAIARGMGRANDPTAFIGRPVAGVRKLVPDGFREGIGSISDEPAPARAATAGLPGPAPSLGSQVEASHAHGAVAVGGLSIRRAKGTGATRSRRGVALLLVPIAVGGLALAAGLSVRAYRHDGALPGAATLAQQAAAYPQRREHAPSYIATATYAATEAAMAGRQLPWAAWSDCPPELGRGRCALALVQLWYSGGQGRALSEGSAFVCTERQSWGINPMAGLAISNRRHCGPLGPDLAGLGATAGMVATLLPPIDPSRARILGVDLASGQRCWLLALGRDGRGCIDATTGLTLYLERLDHAGQPAAEFRVAALSYGLDLASELFSNPIPGGRAGLIDGLSQPLLDIQAADDQALFVALVPTRLPAGLTAQTPTFESFYDDRRGYALVQRVRQAFVDRQGRVALVLIETLPGSAWDATPPRGQARMLVASQGRRLLLWPGGRGRESMVRIEYDGTTALISSRVLALGQLIGVALGLQ